MAAESAYMIRESPPRWLQRTLLLFLNPRDRETIFGDLLEEYREEQLPQSGSIRADYWYLRQIIGFASIRLLGGPLVKPILILMCLFAVAAGTWLTTMENILKHDGYAVRSVIDASIVLQGVATLLFVLLNGRPLFRAIVLTGAVAIVCLGAFAIVRILRAQHFEGYILLIGLALILQGVLTLATLLSTRRSQPA